MYFECHFILYSTTKANDFKLAGDLYSIYEAYRLNSNHLTPNTNVHEKDNFTNAER